MSDLSLLLDVDNTLLDNDRLKADLGQHIRDLIGSEEESQFWKIYESVRKSEEYVDFPATLDEFARQHPSLPNRRLRDFVMEIPFDSYVYQGAFAAIEYLCTCGLPVILSDGDPVFQMLKIERSGLAAAVGGRILLTVHKQDEMETVFRRYPADHYALIDDKATILADIGRRYGRLITTVLVCQGKYARLTASPGPDLVVNHIGDLPHVPRDEFCNTERQDAGSVAAS